MTLRNLESKLEKISWQAIFIFAAMFFFALNILMPFVADDFSYSFIWDGEHGGNLEGFSDPRERITSFADVLISQWSHYFTWGGRAIAITIAQIFAWIGEIPFDILNTVIFCIVILLILKIGTGLSLRNTSKPCLVFVLVAMYLLTPEFLNTTLWMTGAAVYLWTTVFELMFILPFAMKYRDKNFWNKPPRWSIIFMAVSGLMAGWSVEPGASVVLFVTFWFMIKFWREGNLQTWMKVGFIFFVAGFLLLTLSPGISVRIEITKNIYAPNIDLFDLMFGKDAIEYKIRKAMLPVIFRDLPLFIPIIFYFIGAEKSRDKSLFILNFFAASIIILLGMMVFLPYFPERAAFPSHIFLVTASVAAFKEILPRLEKFYDSHKFLRSGMKILTVALVVHMGACLYVYFDIHSQYNERLKYIAEHRADELIAVPALKLPTWSETFIGQNTWTNVAIINEDITSSPNDWKNLAFAKYYGLNKIKLDDSL